MPGRDSTTLTSVTCRWKYNMSTRFFEEKEHARFYQQFRFKPSQEIIDLILNYVDEKLPKLHGLAVDVGCGSGQGTRLLSPYFEKVLGTDISDAQIEEAKKAPESPNVTFSVGPAEALPVGDASVDLLTACCAVHWFDIGKFLKEVDRILKPRGCLAFYTYTTNIEVHYKDRSEQMCQVFPDVLKILDPYMPEMFHHLENGYKEIFEVIPYTDKRRIDKTITKISIPLSGFLGFIPSMSAFQFYQKIKPKKAKEMLETEKRFLQIMGTSSSKTEVEVWLQNFLVLASKPQ